MSLIDREYDDMLWNRAMALMPRGTQTMSKCPDQYVDGVHPKFAARGKGCTIVDLHGNQYIDFSCALGPIILGYCDPRVDQAIKRQLDCGIVFSLPTTLEAAVARQVCDVVPSAEMVRFAKNGTDATLAAVRIARSYTKREHIAMCGYHGWNDWSAITLRPYGVPSCLSQLVHEFKYNDLQSLEDVLKANPVAGVIMEPQALTPPEPGFLEGVRSLCDKYGSVLIFDEIVTGFRWALGGAQEKFGVTPDLTCLGKAMANGMPLSAICGKKEYMKELDTAFFSMTFGGECLSLAAASETIRILGGHDVDYDGLWQRGDKLAEGIRKAAQSHGLSINFAGSAPRHNLTFTSEYKDPGGMKDLFYQEMVRRGILFGNVVYVNFAHSDHDIRVTCQAAEESFRVVSKNIDRIDDVLQGKRSVAIFRKNT